MKRLKEMTVAEAKNTEIFIINDESKVEKTNLYDHVIISEAETTTPYGVVPRYFVEEEYDGKWVISSWGIGGNNYSRLIDADYRDEYSRGYSFYDSKEEAEDALFNIIFEVEFMKDDQRDTWYSHCKEEAERVAAERVESFF
jgi:hypothetical protein